MNEHLLAELEVASPITTDVKDLAGTETRHTMAQGSRRTEIEQINTTGDMVARTGDEVDDPRMEEEAVGDLRVLRLPPVHGATGTPIEVHLGLLLQQWQRCVALTAGHLRWFLTPCASATGSLSSGGRLESDLSGMPKDRRCMCFWDRSGSCGGWNLWLVISLTE